MEASIAIAHGDIDDETGEMKAVLDVLLEFRPPFIPGEVIDRIVDKCREYHVDRIMLDRQAIAWIASDYPCIDCWQYILFLGIIVDAAALI